MQIFANFWNFLNFGSILVYFKCFDNSYTDFTNNININDITYML